MELAGLGKVRAPFSFANYPQSSHRVQAAVSFMSDREPRDAPEHTVGEPGLLSRCRGLLVPAVAIVGLAIASYFGWRYFFPAVDPEAREMLHATWRVTSPNERPVADAGALGGISAVEVDDVDTVESEVDRQIAKLDPARDGWESEILSQRVSQQLALIRKAMSGASEDMQDRLAPMVSDDFSCPSLRPKQLSVVFHGPQFVVRRYDPAAKPRGTYPQSTNLGAAGLAAALRDMIGSNIAGDLRAALKVVRVSVDDGHLATTVLVEIAVPAMESTRQINARWICQWTLPTPGSTDRPLLLSIHVEQFEEVTLVNSDKTLFADCTEAAFGSLEFYGQQYLHGNNYWSQRLSVLEATSILGNYGLAVADVNGDGLEDLYVCDGGGLPNRLLMQNDDGTLRDASAEAGVDWLEYSTGALLLDLDNDGDQDLVVATVELVLFMENDGSGKFTFRGGHRAVVDPASLDPASLCAADYDNDGDLDIYVCSYESPDRASGFRSRGFVSGAPIPYNDANNGSPNALLENRGKFRFINVTDEVGLGANNTRFSYAAAWEDYDNDGDQDLYVANDYGRNNLYRNDGGRFVDVAAATGVEDMASGMSVSWADANRDGRMDLYVGNMFSAAGNRVTFQRKFTGSRDDAKAIQRTARGNSLFAGRDDGTFEDVSEAAQVTMARWAWSSRFADLNNDGWPDLVVANGFLTNRRDDDL
jgi:hypothetical protein